MKERKPDVAAVLSRLKDFQVRTAKTAFSRLYLDEDAVDRFLVADEVGLGKTLIAQSVIAQAVAHLWDHVRRIDIVYVCSNADIARQNIRRLELPGTGADFTEASRLTLFPLHSRGLDDRKINFVSLTPATSLDLRGSQGAWRERALLYRILEDAWGVKHVGAKNLLQGQIRDDAWWRRRLSDLFDDYDEVDRPLLAQIASSFRRQKELRQRYEDLAERSRTPRARDASERRELIGELRRVLAKECLDKLQPDLIVLDEFQRFKHLLEPDGEDADLARALFEYKSKDSAHERARMLLLSATPYKMYTQGGDGEDHHADFLRTVRALLQDDAQMAEFKQALRDYREALADGLGARARLRTARHTIERILRRVMCRTERLGISVDRNGMVSEKLADAIELDVDDVIAFAALDRVARAVESTDTIEIWKSAALPLALMDQHYALKRRVAAQLPHDEAVRSPLLAARSALVPADTIERYEPLQFAHARTREIARQTVDSGAWQLLWLPPSLPYWRPTGAHADPALARMTKRLIFSSWKVAPKALAGLLSYEAERRMVSESRDVPAYRRLYEEVHPVLRFATVKDRAANMSLMTLFYPSPAWAALADPLDVAISLGDTASSAAVLDVVAQRIEERLRPHIEAARAQDGPIDHSWYWAAPLLLDRAEPGAMEQWLGGDDEWSWPALAGGDAEESHFAGHVEQLRSFLREPAQLGRPPEDLLHVLASIVVASPAVVSLRSLLRVSGDGNPTVEHLGAAAWIALGFRRLFNVPETMIFLRGDAPERYWQRVLEECIAGNLQAVMDEYAHVLRESLGASSDSPRNAYVLAEEIEAAVALRTTKIEYDDLAAFLATKVDKIPSGSIRCRFALRFGDGKTHDDEDLRPQAVRSAFNSPFRPFVLASTSVGQEGLDFHTYCHAIVHWNLPSNPVDFEQREGRIHRYKGHFVRKNLAARYGLAGMRATDGEASRDPWDRLFGRAVRDRPEGRPEIEPFWIFEGEHRIERHIPLLPLSRDVQRYEALKSSLALYRLVFGQPRQDELLGLLNERWTADDIEQLLAERIDLQPRSE